MNGFIKQDIIMDEADNNYYASGLLQKMRDSEVHHRPGELAMSCIKPDNQEMNGTIKNENTDTSNVIKQEITDEADDSYTRELSQKMRDCKVSQSPEESTMPHTKPDNQEMNETIQNECVDGRMDEGMDEDMDTSDDHNKVIRLLPRRRGFNGSNSPEESMMQHTKPDDQEMNGTIQNKCVNGCMDECMGECIDTSDDHNNVIRLLPRRSGYETENRGISFYGRENYDIDIIDGYVFEGYICTIINDINYYN